MTGTDAEDDPAGCEAVEGGCGVGYVMRLPNPQPDDVGAQRECGRRGKCNEGITVPRVVADE
ncbi:MAG: hypothetical protein M3513_13655 [Actinomycetota bacterium]|nr:hypothetical protein [Actinomycetota bacterium]